VEFLVLAARCRVFVVVVIDVDPHHTFPPPMPPRRMTSGVGRFE
jgi:hypothetical protein